MTGKRCQLPQEPERPGAGDGLGAVGRAELAEDVAYLFLDGIGHHHELVSNLLVDLPEASSPSTSCSRGLRGSATVATAAVWRAGQGAGRALPGRKASASRSR